ncbi:hypothetical protein WKH57_01300 [Niallia taxi]|uniref:hypothetical protein n=1 Tax=Niallia taxi TaxID=2499688 RepID=UPI00316BEA98
MSKVVSINKLKYEKEYKEYAMASNYVGSLETTTYAKEKRSAKDIRKEMTMGYMKMLSNYNN